MYAAFRICALYGGYCMNIDHLASMYSRCEITTIALQDKTFKKSPVFYNLYSLVELCSENQELSERIGNEEYACVRYPVNSKYNVIIQRDFLDDVQDGLDFYRGRGNIHQLGKDIWQDFEPLTEEPPNEHCVLFNANEKKGRDLSKVLPHFDRSIWLAMKISNSNRFLSLLTEEERWNAGKFIEKELGIPLAFYTEFWGGIFLCAKNAQLRTVDYQLGKDKRSLLVSLLPTENDDFFKGTMELFDERRYGTGFCIRKEINQCRFIVPFPYEPKRLHVRIYDRNGQLIIDQSGTFIRNFQFLMGIQSGYRIFDNGNDRIQIPMATYEKFSIGDSNDSVENMAFQAEQQRYLKSLEEKRIFIYFSGKEEEKSRAAGIVKELIAGAKERCVICDPYFSRKDLLNYGIHVTSFNVVLKIITSAVFLKSKVDSEPESRQGDVLYAALDSLNKHEINVKCYVLRGKKSPIHDRFIVVDDDVYLLGSSLSEFGSRATTLYRVPDPKLLIRQAERWIKDKTICPSLEEWMKNREVQDDEPNNSIWDTREIVDIS